MLIRRPDLPPFTKRCSYRFGRRFLSTDWVSRWGSGKWRGRMQHLVAYRRLDARIAPMKHLPRLPLLLTATLLPWTCSTAAPVPAAAAAANTSQVSSHSRGLSGYIGYSATRPAVRTEFGAGMGFYAAVWPLIDQPNANFQIGLPSAWILPDNWTTRTGHSLRRGPAPANGPSAARLGAVCSKRWRAVWDTGLEASSVTGRRSSA